MTIMFKSICIIGTGLIGGSIARAMRRNKLCRHIIGYGRNEQNLMKAKALGVIDEYSLDLEKAIANVSLVIIATPLGAMKDLFVQLKQFKSELTIMTDVGSAKTCVIDAAKEVYGEVPSEFVPGHPIAGTENSGVEASFAELYDNRRVILTPHENIDPEALNVVRELWTRIGAKVSEMPAEHHDEVLAATSHLPHVLAFSLVDTLARMNERQEIFDYAAGGFSDFTRIASSDPVMWRDILFDNQQAIVEMIDLFQEDLSRLRASIESNDSEHILEIFQRAKQARDNFKM